MCLTVLRSTEEAVKLVTNNPERFGLIIHDRSNYLPVGMFAQADEERIAPSSLEKIRDVPIILYRPPEFVTPDMRDTAQRNGWADLVDNPVDLFSTVLRLRAAASSSDWSLSDDPANISVFYALNVWFNSCPDSAREP
jgi:hypothetical protein